MEEGGRRNLASQKGEGAGDMQRRVVLHEELVMKGAGRRLLTG